MKKPNVRRVLLWLAIMSTCLTDLLEAAVVPANIPESWRVTIPSTSYKMTVLARVRLGGVVLTSANGGTGTYLAAFCNGELRGIAGFDSTSRHDYFNLTVQAKATTEKGYTFQFYDPATATVSTCAETLNYLSSGYGTFDSNNTLNPQILTVSAQPQTQTQTLALKAGWNWIGFTVLPGTKTVKAVLGTTGFSKNDVILGAGVQSTFTGSTWLPSSVELSFGTLYQMYVANDVTVTVNGQACKANTVQLLAGWNWIANSTAAAVTPKELTFGGGLAANDLMISAASQVTYTGKSWLPSSGFTLLPGAGCQVYVARGGTLTFPPTGR